MFTSPKGDLVTYSQVGLFNCGKEDWLTSAIMKPFSKSVWIFPAAWGAFVPC